MVGTNGSAGTGFAPPAPPDVLIRLYLAVSFGFAWACWCVCWLIADKLISAPLTPLLIVGSFGPFIAAGLCALLTGGWRAVPRFYGRALQVRMGFGVLLAALLLIPALGILAAWIYARQTGEPLVFQLTWAELPAAYLWLFILGGPLAEEFGWSALSDQLDRRLPVPAATLLLGVIWAFWHLPLFFLSVPGLTQRYIPFGLFLLMSIAARFLFSWAYHRAGGNVLSNLLFHNSHNLALTIVTIVPPILGADHLRLWYLTLAMLAAAVALWTLWPPVLALELPAKVKIERGG